MPSRHVVKQLASDNYYHVYNRGVNKSDVFLDSDDYFYFLHLFKRHLSNEPLQDKYGRDFAHLLNKVELLAFCLMPNHFHLLVYNQEDKGLPELMHRLMTAYSMYFNKRHKRVGSLFQGTYKASLIDKDDYLLHISRYIHLNPQDINVDYETYDYSSFPYYMKTRTAEWLRPDKIMELHDNSTKDYRKFVSEYKAQRKDLKLLKGILADT
ncbi:MAG: transposase [Candidatus Saccharibacteria bacterium]|nr:transposase [Candidatus Saccharibacteria bacterium]